LAMFLTAIVAILGLAGVYLIQEFAIYLGFNLDTSFTNATAAILVTISLLAALILRNRIFNKKSLGLTGRQALAATIGASLAVRIYFAVTASIYPDEFGTLLILAKKPLQDVANFLVDYGLYADGYVCHPPLGYLLMSFGYSFVPSYLGPRLISIAFSLGAIIVVYSIISELRYVEPLYPTVLFAFIPHTIVFFSLATTDVYMNFFGMLGLYFSLKAAKTNSMKSSCFAGLLIALSLWSKASLGVFWLILSLVAILLLDRKGRLMKLKKLGAICIVFFLAYIPWYFVNPYAFYWSMYPLLYIILGFFGRKGYSIWSINPIEAAGTGKSPFISWMASIFPRLTWAGGSTISYIELLVQLPLWFTPIVSLLIILGFSSAVRRLKGLNTLLLLWLLVPFLGMLIRFRDVRYLLISGIPLVIFAVTGDRFSNRNLRFSIRSLTLAFIAVFLTMTAPIVQQQYYGVEQAAFEIKNLKLEDSTILTNCRHIEYYLPNTKLIYIEANQNSATIKDTILKQDVKAVLILHNARGAWPQIDNSTEDFLSDSFDGHVSKGLSEFSWFELFYIAH